MAELDDEITRLIRGGDQKLKAPAEADPYAEMETTFKKGYEREPPSISVGGKEIKLEKPPAPTISPFDVARGRRDLTMKAAEAATEKARLEAGVEASAAERMKGIAGRAREMEAPPRFTPTPEDKATMVGMFGLLGAMAAFVGGGKQYGNALSAMNAMGGMLAGYNQGRKDLFEKDKQIYDKKVAENKAHNDHIKQLINTAMEEAKYDYTKAKANLKIKLAEIDAPVIKAQVDQKTLEDLRNDVDKADLAYTNNLKAQGELIQKMKGSLDSQKRSFVIVDGQQKYLTDAEIVEAQNEGKKIAAAPRSGRSMLATQFEDMTTIAVNEAALNIGTLVNSPFATTGVFQGRNTGNLIDAPLGALANNLTSQSVQQYNTMMGNIGTYITKIIYGGRVVPAGVQKSFTDRYSIREGDKPFTVLTKLADLRQTFERAIEVKMKSEATSEGMKEVYKNAKEEIDAAIPFTMNDVNRVQKELASSKGQKLKTFGDFMTEKMGTKETKGQTTSAPKATLNGRTITVRDGRWVYEDTGEPAQ